MLWFWKLLGWDRLSYENRVLWFKGPGGRANKDFQRYADWVRDGRPGEEPSRLVVWINQRGA
jgi:hypothetical protein